MRNDSGQRDDRYSDEDCKEADNEPSDFILGRPLSEVGKHETL